MIWQCWLTRVFSEMKAQSYHPDREARSGVRSLPTLSECCPTTLHLHTDCRICQLYFHPPKESIPSRSSQQTYTRKISAPEERSRYRRMSRHKISSVQMGSSAPQTTRSTSPVQIEEPLELRSPNNSETFTDRPLSAEALVVGKQQVSAVTQDTGYRGEDPRVSALDRMGRLRERKTVTIGRSVSFAGERRTYQY